MSNHTPGPWIREPELDTATARRVSAFAADSNRQMVIMVESFNPDNDATLIMAAPELLAGMKALYRAYVSLLEAGRDRIIDLGGSCDPVERLEDGNQALIAARTIVAKATAVA